MGVLFCVGGGGGKPQHFKTIFWLDGSSDANVI